MKKNIRKHESGRSMIEMVGVLAVTGLLTAGAFVLIQSGMESQRRNRAADEINTLVANVRGLAAESENFNIFGGPVVASNAAAISSVPSNAQQNRARLLLKLTTNSTPVGGSYAITGAGNLFTIWIMDMDADSCSTMELRSFSEATWVHCYTLNSKRYLTITYTR